jgi:UrcA family protein
MKTPYLLPVAMLILAGPLSAQPAAAEPPGETIQARYAYDPTDSAQRIYSGLKRTAEDACHFSGRRSLTLRKHELSCVKEMLDDGVAKMGRADVALIHNRSFAVADSRG